MKRKNDEEDWMEENSWWNGVYEFKLNGSEGLNRAVPILSRINRSERVCLVYKCI